MVMDMLPNIITVLWCGAIALSLILYSEGGIKRLVSLISLASLGWLALASTLAILLFNAWEGAQVSLLPWYAVALFSVLPAGSLLLQHFLVCWLGMLGLGPLSGLTLFIRSQFFEETVHGDAHFASIAEIKKAGVFEDDGIIVGKAHGKTLKAGGFEHVLAFSPAGSGKTTSIAIPNLLTWKDSCVVNDTKYELFELTSQHRKERLGNEVFLWAPTRLDGKTHRYNPLKFISKDPFKRISDIQLMSHVLIPNGQQDPIWYQSARELFLALVLYLLDTSKHATTFAELYNLSKQHHFNQWLEDIVKNTTHYDPEFYRNASSYLNTAEKTRASILKTFTGYLEIFANPIINAATSDSDFDLRDLRKTKMTIYIGFPDNEKEMISPLLTLFWQQLIAFMTEKLPNERQEPYPVLCLMDEFSTLGRLVNLKNSLKILRGYRVRVLIIIQY